MIGIVTVGSPRALQRWIGTLVDPRSSVAVVANMELEALAAQVLGSDVAYLCDFDRPLHVAFIDADGKDMVVSVAGKGSLRDVERKLGDAVKLTPVSSDVWMIDMQRSSVACELHRAGTEARFVCGKNAASVGKHSRQLVAKGASTKSGSGVRFEVERDFYRHALGKLSRDEKGSPKQQYFDDLFAGFGRETVDAALGLALTGSGPVFSIEGQFGKVENVFSTLLVTSQTEKASDVKSFWRLPKDSSLAFHFSGGDPEKTRKAAAPFFEKWVQLDMGELDDEAREKERQAMSRLFFTGGPLDVAFGMDLEKAKRGVEAWEKKQASLEKTRRAVTSWLVVGVEQPASDVIDALRSSYEAEAKGHARAVAAGRTISPQTDERYLSTTAEAKAPVGKGLPKGSAHFVQTKKPNPNYAPTDAKKPAGTASVGHIYVVPDGARSWLCFSNDDALAKKKGAELLAGRTTLSPSGPLELLGQARGVAFGFVTGAALVSAEIDTDSATELAEARAELDRNEKWGDARTIPWTFSLQNQPAPSDERRLVFELHVPTKAVEGFARSLSTK